MHKEDQELLQSYRDRLRVNKHRLDDELEVQAETQERIADRLSEAEMTAARLKDELAKTEARLTEDYREEVKSTKDTVEAKVRRHKDRVDAWERHQEAVGDAAKWGHLLDAWKGRGKDIQALARLFGDQYFAPVSAGEAPRGKLSRPGRVGRQQYGAD